MYVYKVKIEKSGRKPKNIKAFACVVLFEGL